MSDVKMTRGRNIEDKRRFQTAIFKQFNDLAGRVALTGPDNAPVYGVTLMREPTAEELEKLPSTYTAKSGYVVPVEYKSSAGRIFALAEKLQVA